MIKKFIASPIDSILNKKSKNAIENKAVAEAIEQIESDIARLEGLKASLSQYGSVKLSSATDVTDSTGLALPVTEKNPAVSGTIANDVKKIEDRLIWENRSASVLSNVMGEDGSRTITYSLDLAGVNEVLISLYVKSYSPSFYGAIPLVLSNALVPVRYISNQKHEWAGEIRITKGDNKIFIRTYVNYPNPNINYFELNNIWTR